MIIPTFGRPDELQRCLEAISKCSFDRQRYEVIVVNDGGPAPELTWAERSGLNVRVLQQANRGPAAARNHGARSACGQFLAFIDDDCVPATDWLARLETSVTLKPHALHGGRTVNLLTGNPCSQASQSLVDYVYRYYNDSSANRTWFFASNNMSIAANRFALTDGFDESFRAAEDRDFCRSWHARGGDFQYSPEVIVYHAHRLNLRTLQKQHFSYGRGALPYWRKAAGGKSTKIRVEPLAFYSGMLFHPFAQKVPAPALVASLILISQVANAAGFAYEAFRSRARAGAKAQSRASAPAET